jgi:hypothetical protein
MQVCDVCFGSPDFAGTPQIKPLSGQTDNQYLFGTTYKDNHLDLCKECRAAFKARDWSEIAKRQKQVVQQHVISESAES